MLVMPRTATVLDPSEPSAEPVDVADIACALSVTPLFGSQTVFFYSLAQHAVDVRNAARRRGLPDAAQLVALHCCSVHAYVPIGSPRRDAWREAIATALGLRASENAAVDEIEAAVRVEAAGVLLSDGGEQLAAALGREPVELSARGPRRQPVASPIAERSFLSAHEELRPGLGQLPSNPRTTV
jgi:hypothetical protein